MRFDAATLDVGGQKQFFVDDMIIETVCELTRTLHQPVKFPGTGWQTTTENVG